MKKVLSIFICVAVTMSCMSFSVSAGSAKTVKNNYKKSDWGNLYTNSNLLYVNKKYIFANEKGIYVKKSLTAKGKKITGKVTEEMFLSDGKTVYFTVNSGGNLEQRKYAIYSVKTNGKGLKKIKSGKGLTELITVYKGNLYYGYAPQGSLYCTKINKMNLSSKKSKCISGKRDAAFTDYYNGRIYFSEAMGTMEYINENAVYSVDLKTEKIKKVVNHAFIKKSYSGKTKKKLWIDSYTYNLKSNKPTNHYIYIINSNNKKTRSKKLPDNSDVAYVNPSCTYAIIRYFGDNNYIYYKLNLKTCKKAKISGITGYWYVVSDAKSGAFYFVGDSGSRSTHRMKVKKLFGTKTKTCKIGGKSSINLIEYEISGKIYNVNYWISDGCFVVNEKGKFKSYKLM